MSVTSVDRLRRFVSRATDHSCCDLCRCELTHRHRHLLELFGRRMLCACDACALLFSDANGSRIRPIPQSVTRIDLNLSDAAWAGLGIPIGMAFFTLREPAELPDPSRLDREGFGHQSPPAPGEVAVSAAGEVETSRDSTAAAVTVGYPSPAGPVMSSVENNDWQALLRTNPEVGRLRPEVQSLLVNRTAPRRQAFVVPLDVCFELIGIVRQHWQGWSGGPDVHREIDRYFDQLDLSAEEGPPS